MNHIHFKNISVPAVIPEMQDKCKLILGHICESEYFLTNHPDIIIWLIQEKVINIYRITSSTILSSGRHRFLIRCTDALFNKFDVSHYCVLSGKFEKSTTLYLTL